MSEEKIERHSKPLWTEADWFGADENDLIRSYYHQVGRCIGLHENEFYELNLVVAGEGRHFIGDQAVDAGPGYVCVIPPQTAHGYRNAADLNVFHLLIRGAFLERYARELQSLPGFMLLFEISPYIARRSAQALSFRLDEGNFSELIGDIDALVALEKQRYPGRGVHAAARALCLLATLSSYLYDTRRSILRTQNPGTQALLRSIEYIRVNAGEDICVDELVRESNMSRSSYTRLFKQLTGCMPHAFLLRCRVTKARRLLCYTDLTLAAIAQECGFFDSSHFIRVFSREERLTPAAYRQLHAGKAGYAACTLCAPPAGGS